MNFISRQVAANARGEVVPDSLVPWLNTGRKWPIRYGSIERLAICADLAVILLASLVSALLYRIHGGWAATDLGKALGSAIVVSALFVSLLNMYGRYRPTELLVLRNQVRVVCLAWTFVFLLLAAAVGALNIGHEFSHSAGMVFAVVGLVAEASDMLSTFGSLSPIGGFHAELALGEADDTLTANVLRPIVGRVARLPRDKRAGLAVFTDRF